MKGKKTYEEVRIELIKMTGQFWMYMATHFFKKNIMIHVFNEYSKKLDIELLNCFLLGSTMSQS